jgi:hypothetical protein
VTAPDQRRPTSLRDEVGTPRYAAGVAVLCALGTASGLAVGAAMGWAIRELSPVLSVWGAVGVVVVVPAAGAAGIYRWVGRRGRSGRG